MYNLLRLREDIIFYYKKYDNMVDFLIKLVLAFFTYKKLFEINLYAGFISSLFKPNFIFLMCMLLSVAFAFMPLSLSYLFMIFVVCLSISKSVEVSVIVFFFLLLVLFFYARISTKESIFILLTVLAFYFKIQFLIPIIAGLYFGITSVIPITLGTFIWRSIPMVKEVIEANVTELTSVLDLVSVPQNIFTVADSLFKAINSSQQWILESLVLSMVVFLVFFVSKLAFNYAKEVSIVLGGLLSIVAFLILVVFSQVKISFMYVLFMNIFCMLIALIIRFFDNVLDYQSAERLEFEDEMFFYYVKAVPKIKSKNATKKVIKPKKNNILDNGGKKDKVRTVKKKNVVNKEKSDAKKPDIKKESKSVAKDKDKKETKIDDKKVEVKEDKKEIKSDDKKGKTDIKSKKEENKVTDKDKK